MKSEKELLIGMAIGDGCILKDGSLKITHSSPQWEYLDFKKQLLESNGINFRTDRIEDARGFGINKSKTINTSSSLLIKELRKYLYPNNKKIIPDDLIITPQMWAFIYQDDGRQNKSTHYFVYKNNEKIKCFYEWVNRYSFYTDSFDNNSINNLIKSLDSYNIKGRINYSNKNKLPHIHISDKKSKTLFKEMISPFIYKSMLYKINLPVFINN